MPENRKQSMFGHPSIANSPMTQGRINDMMDMVRSTPEEAQPGDDANNMAPVDLEQLVFLGRIQDTKVINGFTFELTTLTGREQNDVWLSVSFLTNDTKFFVVKIAFLAKAVVSVNGRALDTLYKSKDYRELTKEQRAMRVVESWQDTLIDELYQFYSQIVDRSKKAITPEAIKK
jgi:hypothetical protein